MFSVGHITLFVLELCLDVALGCLYHSVVIRLVWITEFLSQRVEILTSFVMGGVSTPFLSRRRYGTCTSFSYNTDNNS